MDGSTLSLDLISGSNTTAQQLCCQIIQVLNKPKKSILFFASIHLFLPRNSNFLKNSLMFLPCGFVQEIYNLNLKLIGKDA